MVALNTMASLLIVAAAAAITLPTEALSISNPQVVFSHPPKSILSSSSSTALNSSTPGHQQSHTPTSNPRRSWGRGNSKKGRSRRNRQQPLQAYTVADRPNNKPSWASILKMPNMGNPFAEFASQFSEGKFIVCSI